MLTKDKNIIAIINNLPSGWLLVCCCSVGIVWLLSDLVLLLLAVISSCFCCRHPRVIGNGVLLFLLPSSLAALFAIIVDLVSLWASSSVAVVVALLSLWHLWFCRCLCCSVRPCLCHWNVVVVIVVIGVELALASSLSLQSSPPSSGWSVVATANTLKP